VEDSESLRIPLIWSWDYHESDGRIRGLYDKAVSDQWSAAEALDWSVAVDPVRAGRAIGGSLVSPGLVAQLSPAQRDRLTAGMGAMSLSQLLHGEQGALMVSANLVRLLPGVEMKEAAAAQTGDEARHLDVFSRYIRRIGTIYPPSPPLRRVLDKIVSHPLWLAQLIGMQIVVEGVALATFLDMRSTCACPLLHGILDLVIKDEARHVAFGKIALRRQIDETGPEERAMLDAFTLDSVQTFRNWGTEPEDLVNNTCVMIEAGIDPTDVIAALRQGSSEGRPLDLSRGMRYAFAAFILPNLEQLGLIAPGAAASLRAGMQSPGEDLAALDRLRDELVR
jgi:hypothetical protein